jgi:teichuronic acid biosynthesis glycosyltransferase TuaC
VKILVFTTVFPSATHPVHGLFVAERTRHASVHAEIRVVAPVAWFRRRPQSTEAIAHPRFFYLPGLFKVLDGLLLFLSAISVVSRLRRSFDFDLIDAHFGFPDGVAAVLLGWWCRRPVTITLRGSELDMVAYKLRRLALGWAVKRADRVIGVSSELASLAITLGASPSRVRVIGNGVDTTRFRPVDRLAARRELGLAERGPLVISVGHLARVKGFHLLLRALPGVAVALPALRFVIVGGPAASSGGYPARLANEIATLDLTDRVTITGVVPPDRVALWLNAADLFVLASEREGSPNVLREALACGCPVVASDVGDARQIVRPDAGFIVSERNVPAQWRDAILNALRTTWDRGAIRSDAERYSWSDVGSQVAAEWRSCIEGNT